ncbi:tyrosine-type recombinase/integrase [Chitiniphilus eburneus]|uniref:tyrosine-type recombinase/integrase n=1 Tax=Chitiniphilus eburneus TaxID=2571148 RepID=UPI0035D00836
MRGAKTWYYYDAGGKPRREIPLGSDYVAAVQKWAELEHGHREHAMREAITFPLAAQRYIAEVIPTKGSNTQDDNMRELKNLLEFFGNPPAPLDSIEPVHITMYLDWRIRKTKAWNVSRGKPDAPDGRVRANREKALFSDMWNSFRSWGYTAMPNPCAGVSGFKEVGRDIYVDDAAYSAVYQVAAQPLRDTMDLLWLTGQRPGDVLKFTETDIKDGALGVRQNKTKMKVRIQIEGLLHDVLARIEARKRTYKVRSLKLLVDDEGHALTYSQLRRMFDEARAASGQTWQMRDLRAKAGTEADDQDGEAAAQRLLAHTTPQMTRRYIRNRLGKLAKPPR